MHSGVDNELAGNYSDFIVRGTPAQLGEFPHVIILKYQGSFTCGGSLIASNVVLTAAHCVVDYLPGGQSYPPVRGGLTITAGTVNLNNGGVVVQVQSIYSHPQYTPSDSYVNDIAILKVLITQAIAPHYSHRVAR